MTTMKTVFAILMLTLLAGAAPAQQAPNTTVAVQDKTQPSPRLNPVEARAGRLSTQMVRDLRLNSYQATRLRSVNADKAAKMATIERQNAGNQTLIDEQYKGIYRERDQELQAFLTNDQYTNYFGARSNYNKIDRDFANQSASILLTEAVQNPAPARANDATIAPANTKGGKRPAGNLGRNAR